MASLGGGIVGGAALGSLFGPIGTIIGGAIGAMAGSYIDNRYLFPAIFPPDHQKPPELQDIGASHQEDGGPAPLAYGPEVPVVGTYIWIGETRLGALPSGKGRETTTGIIDPPEYLVNCAIAWHVGANAIDAIDEIIMEGRRLYVDTTDVDIDDTTSKLSIERYETNRWNSDLATDATELDDVYMIVKSAAGGPDLSALRSGLDASVGGFSNGANNGTFRVLSSTIDTGSGESEARLRNADCITEGVSGATKTVDQTLSGNTIAHCQSVTNHLGTYDQAVDSIYELERGANEVPAYRGTAYTVIEDLVLTEFGNRLPQPKALVRAHATKTIASVISDILTEAGFTTSEYDVSALSGSTRGILRAGPVRGLQLLTPLMLAYNITARESQGVLTFEPRTASTTVALTATDIGALPEGSNPRRPIEVADVDEDDLPAQVTVNYLDPFNDSQRGSQLARNRSATGDGHDQAQFPIVMTGQDAVDIANRILWMRIANSQAIRLRLPPSYMHVEEGDILTFTLEGADWRVFVLKVEQSPSNYMIHIEGTVDVASTKSFSGLPAETPPQPTRTTYVPPETRTEILDIAPIRSADIGMGGFYWAMASYDRASPVNRTHLFQASNAALSNWSSIQTMRVEAVVGEVVDATAVPDRPAWWWDDTTEILVKLYQGTLSSSNDLDVLNGDANIALIGDEIIGFVNATDQGDNTWKLTRLARGRQGTERWTKRHAIHERFILLTEGSIREKNKNRNHINRVFAWEGVPHGGSQGDYGESTFPNPSGVYRQNRMRRYPPVGLQIQHNSSKEYWLYWEPRDFMGAPFMPGGGTTTNGQFNVQFWASDPHASMPIAITALNTVSVGAVVGGTQGSLFVTATLHASAGLALGDPHYVTVLERGGRYEPDSYISEALFVDL